MPFGTISSQTKDYTPRSSGIYSLSTTTFSSPQDEYRMRAGSVRKDNSRTAGVTRVLQKDVTVNGVTNRIQAVVSLSVTVPNGSGFTAAEVDSLALDISNFLTADTASRLLQGEE